MQANSISVVAYGFADGLAVFLLCIFLVYSFKDRIYLYLAMACAMTAVWLFGIVQIYSLNIWDTQVRLSLELARNLVWTFVILRLLSPSLGSLLVHKIYLPILLLSTLAWVLITFARTWFPNYGNIVTALLLIFSNIIAVLGAEQLYKASRKSRLNKILAMILAVMFSFDIYMFTHSALVGHISVVNLQARGAIAVVMLTLIASAVALFRGSAGESSKISFSNESIFYSSSLALIGFLILILILAGYYIELTNTSWGLVFYSLGCSGSLIIILSLYLSGTVRSRFYESINRHLFGHKYDYRKEWIKVIDRLSSSESGKGSYEKVSFELLSSVFRSPAGVIWVLNNNRFEPAYTNIGTSLKDLPRFTKDEKFLQTMYEKDWVFTLSGKVNNRQDLLLHQIPKSIFQIREAWIIVPYLSSNELVGFCLLTQPAFITNVTWEDLDLLKTIGRQVANYIKLYQQDVVLKENSQLTAFTRFTAFIVHDLNNVIAQQALLLKNAEKHKSNPAFIDDMIMTVENSVQRMTNLLDKLQHEENESSLEISLIQVLLTAVERNLKYLPEPALKVDGDDLKIVADKEKLTMALSHLIKNAQDSTDDNGFVNVTMNVDNELEWATILIEDNGKGMTQEFIDNKLFRPFETTKIGQGMGLGAYLTKQYVNQLDGHLDVESTPGKGTTFTIRLKGKVTTTE
ncbi:XrtA/PEP-CTERM system histidine kinase PrsK [Gynuella sp.]|uniref:XrtA/PEP-CTERM system histidine kinase PrsK n=1 Tax=Gynuella sp. TaxID=2969146 RepID=UPI003D116199